MKTLMCQKVKEVFELKDKNNKLMVRLVIFLTSFVSETYGLRITLSFFPINKKLMARGEV